MNELPLVGELYVGVDGNTHVAQYEVDEYTPITYEGYCVRCRTPNADNPTAHVCAECISEAWQKAESYGGSRQMIEARVSLYLAEWRS